MNSSNENDEYNGTARFIKQLEDLKEGDLGIIRSYFVKEINDNIMGFDLFAGIWWKLRQNNRWAPKREVAWLVTTLYAKFPLKHEKGFYLAKHYRNCIPNKSWYRYRNYFDVLLQTSFENIETPLSKVMKIIKDNYHYRREIRLDWVQLTNDLSRWDKLSPRIKWAKEFLNIQQNSNHNSKE